MLPPALGGLRFRVPPVPGRCAPGSMSKIMPGIAAYLPSLNRTGELYHTALANGKGGVLKIVSTHLEDGVSTTDMSSTNSADDWFFTVPTLTFFKVSPRIGSVS